MQFELPKHLQEEWFIRENVNGISVGMALYYAPDGTIHILKGKAPRYTVRLQDLSDDEMWTVSREDLEENLYADWFPVAVRA
jgi:hypothetical protein